MEAYLYLLNYFFILLISIFILKLFFYFKKDKLNLKKEAQLLVLEGKEKLALKEEEIVLSPYLTIGRDENNDLIIYDHFVSLKHAFIFKKEEQFYIEDLGSSNGTFINNQKILKPHLLSFGDEIKIGEVIFKINK
ncbi:MAG: FHA domain-containing protein [Armatimonadetes bacterium]|nr:FHA domain-containing protein [Armatimonadota bacterium]